MLKKALVAYAGAFVAVVILAKAAIVGIGLPDWVFPGALIVMALGLPVILFTAYTQFVVRGALTMSPTLTPRAAAASATHGTMAAIALKASPHVSWRRATLGGLSALGVFIGLIGLFMLLRAFGIGPAGSLIGRHELSSGEPMLITDFKISNTDSALGGVVSDAVRAALSQSSVISLVSPSAVAGELGRMQQPVTTRLDLALAREVAQRQGLKAVVDGSVTGVTGGYILTLRLVTADSGVELASFRETGDGPHGLIEAADKLARKVRSKIGESLRNVQRTPPLAQVTTASLEALRKYSAAMRANNVEGHYVEAASLAREAVAFDSTFASAWFLVAFAMRNARMPQAVQDSAMERAFRYSDRLSEGEKLRVVAGYYWIGPHRDRAKAAAAYETMRQKGYEGCCTNLSLILRRRGEYARAESLNVRDIGRDSGLAMAYSNAAASELDQGKVKEAEAMLAMMRRRFADDNDNVRFGVLSLLYAKERFEDAERYADSLRVVRDPVQRAGATTWKAALALLTGRYEESRRLDREARGAYRDQDIARVALTDSLNAAYTDAWMHGPSDRLVRTLDATLRVLPLSAVAAADRPYFEAATVYALSGRPDKARAILEQRQREIRDTALLRLQQPDLHTALAEIALAEHNPSAAAEFRLGDLNPSDSSHEYECGVVCLSLNLGRAFDDAGMRDSAIAMYERYIATPFWNRGFIDRLALAGTHKRLGELYEDKGDRQKAESHYLKFIVLWKNADPEFQTRVAEVKGKLARLSDREKR
jgi:tetratricopeptide (TPR) repeat protein